MLGLKFWALNMKTICFIKKNLEKNKNFDALYLAQNIVENYTFKYFVRNGLYLNNI